MEIAVFSDIHGNYVAFEKCVEYALGRRIDTFLFLGDYLGEFPYPQRTMKMIYNLKEKYTCFFVKGNKENYWINRQDANQCEWKDGNITVGALQYCYANQTEKDIDFFRNMPICQEIVLEGAAPILICHGSPNKNTEKMLPNNENTKRIIEECKYDYILCGHTHKQGVIEYGSKVAINPGAVGVALNSGGKAQFLILQQNSGEWKYEFIDLDYDKEKVLKEMQESGLNDMAPYWSQVTKHLILTGEVSHGTVLSKAMKLCAEDGNSCAWYNVPEMYWEKAIEKTIFYK